MAYKKIYSCKRNHVLIASETSLTALLKSVKEKASASDVFWMPSYSNLSRSLRLHTKATLNTTDKNFYEFEELQNSRYNRKKL